MKSPTHCFETRVTDDHKDRPFILSCAVELLQHLYPGRKLAIGPNKTGLHGVVWLGPIAAKYSHALTNTFRKWLRDSIAPVGTNVLASAYAAPGGRRKGRHGIVAGMKFNF